MTLTRRPVGFDDLMLTILTATLRLVPAQSGALFLKLKSQGDEHFMMEAATGDALHLSAMVDFDRTIVGLAAGEDKPVLLEDGAKDSAAPLVSADKSCLALPLPSRGDWKGVLYLGRGEPRAFQDAELDALAASAQMAAVAIDAVEALHQKQDSWLRDGESGLYTEAYFSERLREEQRRNKRYKRRALLMSLTANSHATPDMSRVLGRLLLKQVRETDVAARLSADRYAILFVETTEREARTIVERLESAIEDEYRGRLPISFGLTSV